MEKRKILFIALILISVFLLVYTPHYKYPFPRHIDEWHHITETIRLQKGEYPGGLAGFRIGFHILLLPLCKIVNLVLVYKFLPAIWAVFSALLLFYVVYKKTDNQFYIALFSIIFFASIKSNVNITGLWFFTPLTFSIPFIYLYVYFFTEGIEKRKKKFILISLAIMVLLLFVHSISVLFAIPLLLVYVLFNLRYIRKEWKFFSIFLVMPVMGALFYKSMLKVAWIALLGNLFGALQFRKGWGVLELENSFFELYSLAGYILAGVGLVIIFKNKKSIKRYLAYALWPLTVLMSIIIYRKTDVSYLSPYQRNLYYFAISLPILSAIGLDYVLKMAKKVNGKIRIFSLKREFCQKLGTAIIFIVIVFFSFLYYFDIPRQIDLYEVIDNNDYQAILFLKAFPEKSTVMAPLGISEAVYPISRHHPVATYFFYGNRNDVELFFQTKNCRVKKHILDKYKVKYILSKSKIDCGWKLIYELEDYIYEIN